MLELAAKKASTSAWDEPGTIAFLVIVGMAVILYFLFRSLSRHLRKINEAARQEAAQAEAQHSDGPGGVAGDTGSHGPGGRGKPSSAQAAGLSSSQGRPLPR